MGASNPHKWKINKQCLKIRLPKINYFSIAMYKQLTLEQRYTISLLLQNRTKQKEIAKAINVSVSTVSCELRRNSGVIGRYNWETAQANAVKTKRRKSGNRSIDKDVMEGAKHFLVSEQWSPEQKSSVLAKDGKHVSHETIYRMIRKDKAEGGTLYTHCRHKLKHHARVLVAAAYPYPIEQASVRDLLKLTENTLGTSRWTRLLEEEIMGPS